MGIDTETTMRAGDTRRAATDIDIPLTFREWGLEQRLDLFHTKNRGDRGFIESVSNPD